MENELTFHITMQVKYMYRFLMKHAYSGFGGIVNILISVGAFILYIMGFSEGDRFASAMLLLIAALFTIINPIYLFYKAAKQVKLTPMFQKSLTYKINKSGITVKQGEEELLMSWEDVRKVKETKKDIYIYLSLTRAYIFPKEAYSNEVDTFKKLLSNYLDVKVLKLKKP